MSRYRGLSFYASPISDNLYETPEGFLVAPDVVIARTGWQLYTVRELPQDRAEELGIDITDWSATINVYRSPEEVFSRDTIDSFEGKTVCDNHPPGFVTSDNFKEFACGHVQNVRKGPEALQSGDWPLVADIWITVEELISKVKNKEKRELSCGYSYDLEQVGDKIVQVGILGNHVAVVDKGRAGAEARINDHAIEATDMEPESKPEPAAPAAIALDQSEAGESSSEKNKPREKVMATKNRLLALFGRGLRALAADESTTDEDLAEAAREVARAQGRDCDSMTEEEREAKDKAAKDKAAKDSEEGESEEEQEEGAHDSDVHRVAKAMGDHRCVNCADSEEKCKHCRMHDSLDKIIAENEESSEEAAKDTDMGELKELLGNYLSEEAREPEHAGDEDLDEEERSGEDDAPEEAEEEEEEEEEHAMAHDASNRVSRVRAADTVDMLEPAVQRTVDKKVKQAFDSAPLHDARAFLNHMKPHVARTKDSRVRQAFDAAERQFRPSRASSGGYSAAAQAAGRARDTAPADYQAEAEKNLQEFYNKARKGEK